MATVTFPEEDRIVSTIKSTYTIPGASQRIIDAVASIISNRAGLEVNAEELVYALVDDISGFQRPIRLALMPYLPGWIDSLFGDNEVTKEAKRLLKEGKNSQ